MNIFKLACTILLSLTLVGCGQGDSSSVSATTSAIACAETSASREEVADAIAAPSNSGKLKVEGSQLISEEGEPVQLRGPSTHGLAWYPQYVNQEFFQELHTNWNANVVRLALYTAESGGYCTDGNKAELMQLIDDGVKYATEADMYVIIDWHILSDGNPLTNIDEALTFFDSVSKTYATNNNVLYEICNEPNGDTTWNDIKAYASEVIPVIRANDPKSVILVGTPTWSQEVDKAAADTLDFDNVMYTLHFYAATHKDDLRNKLTAAHDEGLPIFVSEFGICDASGNGSVDYESANTWIELLDSYGASYVSWNLSNKDETSAWFKSSSTKVSGFTDVDLSDEALWFKDILKGEGSDNCESISNSAPTLSSNKTSESDDVVSADVVSEVAGLTWEVTKTNSWQTGDQTFNQYSVKVTNASGSSFDGWSISITFNQKISLSDSWNGKFYNDGETLRITNESYNGGLADGQSAADIGFIVSGNANLAIVS